MPLRAFNVRRLRRRSNRRRVIKGYGFLDFIKRKYRKFKEWGKRKIPSVLQGLKDVGKKHWNEIKESGIPLQKDELLRRGRALASDAVSSTRSQLFGSGLKRLRYVPPERLTGNKRTRWK